MRNVAYLSMRNIYAGRHTHKYGAQIWRENMAGKIYISHRQMERRQMIRVSTETVTERLYL